MNNVDLSNMTFDLDHSDFATVTVPDDTIDLGMFDADSLTISLSDDWLSSGNVQRLTGPDADLEINGKSVLQTLERLEQRLAIIEENPELEDDWQELKSLGDQYRALEAEINNKLKTYNTLKD